MDAAYKGEFFAFSTTLCWSLAVFPFAEAAKRWGPSATNHFRLILGSILLTIVCLFNTSVSIKGLFLLPAWSDWIWFGLSGIFALTIGDFLGFSTYSILGPRIGSVFNTFTPGVVLIFGYFFLNERVNIVGVGGILITIIGVAGITLGKKEKNKLATGSLRITNKGILLGLCYALCQALSFIFAKKGMNSGTHISALQATWIRMLIAMAAAFVSRSLFRRIKVTYAPIIANMNKGMRYAVCGTLLGPTIGAGFAMYAISLIDISIAQTIFAVVPVLVLLWAWIIYKEKITGQAIAGAAISVAGVVLLIWRNQLISLF
jgi:drug/metabolite transporter (DMT)-like permease